MNFFISFSSPSPRLTSEGGKEGIRNRTGQPHCLVYGRVWLGYRTIRVETKKGCETSSISLFPFRRGDHATKRKLPS